MSQAEVLLNEVEAALSVADDGRVDELRGLADRVYAAVGGLRAKVGRCETLWAQARYDEARTAARRGEELRDQIALARSPKLDSWATWCRRLGLPVAPSLDAVAIGSLVERLSSPPVLERLLREFRRMTLGRAPLVDRLRLLRRVSELDPSNPIWKEDIRSYESARHEELAGLVRQAERSADLAAFKALRTELLAAWSTPPPSSLLRDVEAGLGPLERRRTSEELAKLADEIRSAHSTMNEASARACLDRWASLSSRVSAEVVTSHAGEVEPVRAWIAELDRQRGEDREYETACAAVESALDGGVESAELQRLVAALLRLERGVPTVLAARCTSRLEELGRAGGRRFALKLAGVVGGIALLAAALAASWDYRTRQAEIATWQSQLAQAVERRDAASAQGLVDSIERSNATLFSSPELAGLRTRTAELVDEERRRQLAFAAGVAGLETATERANDFDAVLLGVEALARTPEERAVIEEWRARRAAHQDDQRRFRDGELAADVDRMTTSLTDLRTACARDAVEVQELGTACIALAHRLAGAADASPSLRRRAAEVEATAEALVRDALARSSRQGEVAAALSKLEATAQPEPLAAALRAFARAYPDHPRSSSFVRAATSETAWRATEAWWATTKGWGASFRVGGVTTAKERRAQLEQYLRAYPDSPQREEAARAIAYFRHAEGALTDAGPLNIEAVVSTLTNPLMAGLEQVRDGQGRRYYLLDSEVVEQPSDGATRIFVFDYVTNANLTKRQKRWRTDRERIAPVAERAPQVGLAEGLQRMIRERRMEGWETLYLALAERVLASDQLDPVLAGQLTKLLLGLAGQVTPFVGSEVQGLVKELDSVDLKLAWMDPEADGVPPVRTRLVGVLGRIPPLSRLVERIESGLALAPRLRPIGVIGRQIVIADPGAHGTLIVLTGDPLVRTTVGKVVRNEVTVDPSGIALAIPGSLVFLVVE